VKALEPSTQLNALRGAGRGLFRVVEVLICREIGKVAASTHVSDFGVYQALVIEGCVRPLFFAG